jgi:hypothetical protein
MGERCPQTRTPPQLIIIEATISIGAVVGDNRQAGLLSVNGVPMLGKLCLRQLQTSLPPVTLRER